MKNILPLVVLVFFGLMLPAIPASQKVSPIEVKDCSPNLMQQLGTNGNWTCAPGVTFANPTAQVGNVPVNGVATTAMRSDAAPPLADTAVTPASYTNTNLTVDQKGRITAASNGTAPISPGGSTNDVEYNSGGGAFGGITLTNGQLLIGRTGNFPLAASLTAPAAGLTITGGSGSVTFALANDLAALEALSGTGIAARTAADTWALRTLTGTANRLTVTNGTGAAGDPTFDISASYVGQSTITTLGTIGTGVWNGTTIALGFGGTGADLSATGAAHRVLRQSSAGANVTVSQLACADLSDASSGCSSAASTNKSTAAIGWVAGVSPDKAPIFTASTAMTITDIRGKVDVAVGAAATISIFKAPSGTTCASGTNLINGAATFNANGTAATNQSLTLAGAGAPSLSADDTVCLSTANGANFVAGSGIGGITVTLTIP